MPRPSHTLLGALALSLTGCQPSATSGPRPVSVPATTEQGAPRDTPLRVYSDLVRAALQRDGQENQASCLLERSGEGYVLRGASVTGVRPLPMPALDLDGTLESRASVAVLTPFGRHGGSDSAFTLASFSYAPPSRHALVLIVTDRGLYVRGTDAGTTPRDLVTVDEAIQAAQQLREASVFLAAEAQLPLARLTPLLQALAASHARVVLSVNLAADTRLPTAPDHPSGRLCPDGLSDTTDRQGDLTVSQLQGVIVSLRAQASECMGRADAAGAAGGKMTLALRVAANGSVAEACIQHDETGDARLRACVVEEAKKLSFPSPSPTGSVDVQLPLALRASHPEAPALLCERTRER